MHFKVLTDTIMVLLRLAWEYIYLVLADNHLPGTGWRQQGHAAVVKNQAMMSHQSFLLSYLR